MINYISEVKVWSYRLREALHIRSCVGKRRGRILKMYLCIREPVKKQKFQKMVRKPTNIQLQINESFRQNFGPRHLSLFCVLKLIL
jgi:hypothetical protein